MAWALPKRVCSLKARRASSRRRSSRSSAEGRHPSLTRGLALDVEFGHDQVGRVDVDFLSGPKPTGIFKEPSEALVAEKADFGSSRLQRWFGRPPSARA